MKKLMQCLNIVILKSFRNIELYKIELHAVWYTMIFLKELFLYISEVWEVSREEKVGACGETSAGDVQGWNRAGGDSLGNDGPPTER